MPTYVNDGNTTFLGGQNDGLLPHEIRKEQYRRGINVTTKNGALGPRPGFVHQNIEITTTGKVGKSTYLQIFKRGKFQAALSYDADDGTFILAVISGIVFRIDPRNLTAEVIEFEDGDRMNQYRRRIPWSRAGRFVVFFDYPNLPVILENRDIRRSNPDRESLPGVPLPEIPISVLGNYVQNRLWIANAVHEFGASDPVGGINEDAPITFEESLGEASVFLGQFFSLGSQSQNQPITAMGFLQVNDTATGVGPLIVATKNSIYAFRADVPRIDWENIPFGRLLLYNAGISGPRAFTNVNSDLIFLSDDNQVRSLLVGVGDQQRWNNAPISREVSSFLQEFQNKELLDIAFIESHKNRIFVSVAPYAVKALDLQQKGVFDYAHGGMLVLELDNVSALGQNANPAWAGLWTGISPLEMVILENGPYIFSKDDGGTNRLYFMDENLTYDIFGDEPKDIVSRIYTREYDFDTKFIDKEVGSVDYSFTNIEGDFNFKVEHKAGHESRWSLWKDFNYKAKTCWEDEFCEKGDVELPLLSLQSFRELHFGDPEERGCNEVSQDQGTILRQIGLRLTIAARNWRLEGIRLRFSAYPELDRPSVDTCDTMSEKTVFSECEPNDWQLYRTAPEEAWP